MRERLRHFAKGAAVLLLATGLAGAAVLQPGGTPARAQAAETATPEITRYTLSNGLEVVLVPDHRVPKVVFNLLYRVGSMNEPAGRSGFAHLFEHLMFSGTEAYPKLWPLYAGLGAQINASTWEDKTFYYVEGLSAILPLMLSVEADRMANLGRAVDQTELDTQRAVVKNEMRQNVLDKPGAAGEEAIWSGLFPKGHPYSRTVIGSVADLDAATLADVHGFFNTFYVPNNAILILVGDIDVADAKDLIDKTFGLVPRGADVPRPAVIPHEPTHVRLEWKDPVPAPVVEIGFTGPDATAPENAALAVAASLLSTNRYGLLYDRLTGKGLASKVNAFWVPRILGGRFFADAYAVPGVAPEAIEAEMRAFLAEFISQPIDPASVERAKRTLLLQNRIQTEPLKARAEAIGDAAQRLGKPDVALIDDPALLAVTAADVEAAVRKVIRLEDAGVLVIRPGPRGAVPPVMQESSGAPEPFNVAERPAVAVPKLAVREPTIPGLPIAERTTLASGAELVHYRMPAAPLAYVAASSGSGKTSLPPGKEGLTDLAVHMAYRGANGLSYADFSKAADDIGATLGAFADPVATTITLSVPAGELSEGAGLLADAVMRPDFDPKAWSVLVEERLDAVARDEADVSVVAYKSAESRLFPAVDGRPGIYSSADSLRAATLEEAKAEFRRLFRPGATTFYSIGPDSAADVARSLDAAFAGWHADGAGAERKTFPVSTFPQGRKVVLIAAPGASQTALYVGRPAVGPDDPRWPETVTVLKLLGANFTSRLNTIIREQKGLTYGVQGYLKEEPRESSVLSIETPVERSGTGEALADIFKGFEGLKSDPVRQEEISGTLLEYQTALSSMAETASGLFDTLVKQVGFGGSLEAEHARYEAVTKLELEPVRRQAEALAALDQALVVVVGDPEVVMPQLAAIGLKDVEVIEQPAAAAEADRSLPTEEETPPASAGAGAIPEDAADTHGTTKKAHLCAIDPDAAPCLPDPVLETGSQPPGESPVPVSAPSRRRIGP